jgi:hypothetical protein
MSLMGRLLAFPAEFERARRSAVRRIERDEI